MTDEHYTRLKGEEAMTREEKSAERHYPDPMGPHRCEIDPWQLHPSDPDYIPNPHDRWCRVCLCPPSDARHI